MISLQAYSENLVKIDKSSASQVGHIHMHDENDYKQWVEWLRYRIESPNRFALIVQPTCNKCTKALSEFVTQN